MRLSVLGGPADGASIAAAPGPFRWIGPDGGRGFVAPREGRGLYRRARGFWVFVGVEAWVCRNCGVLVVERTAACVFCGAQREKGS